MVIWQTSIDDDYTPVRSLSLDRKSSAGEVPAGSDYSILGENVYKASALK